MHTRLLHTGFRRLASVVFSAVSIAVACSGGGKGGATGPPGGLPVVTGVAPAQARIGDEVTISGSNFGSSAAAVAVTFRGTVAEVVAVTTTAITAIVPVVAPGAAPIGVTVSGSAAADAAFTILQGPVVITGIAPTPIRAGEEITIEGEGFLAPVGNLAPAVGEIGVTATSTTLDTQVVADLPIGRNSFTEIVALVPGGLPPDKYDVEVRIDQQTAVAADVEFLLTPLNHSFAAYGTITSNTYNDLAVDLMTTYDFTFRETSFNRQTGTGTLEAYMNGITRIEGTFDAGLGAFDLGGPVGQDQAWFFTGNVLPDPQGNMTVDDAILTIIDLNNASKELRFSYTDARAWRNNVTLTAKLDVSLGGLVTGNGPLPAGDYNYTSWDPVSWEATPMFHGELSGAWFQSDNPEKHIGTFTGTLRSYYGDFTLGKTFTPILSFAYPLNSSQQVTMIGYGANDQEVARETFDPVDNIGLLNGQRYTLSASIRYADLVPAGNGFTAFTHVGALFVEQGSSAFASDRLGYGFH